MLWKDVTYLLDGFWCSLVFDTSKHPDRVERYEGKICCKRNSVPYLEHNTGTHFMFPPGYAIITSFTPSKAAMNW